MNYEQKYNEDYVSFETAKLLKEKGFECATLHYYYDKDGDLLFSAWRVDASKNEFGAPTLQMVMKWLREVHKIHCDIGYDDCDWFWNIVTIDKNVPVEDRPLFIKIGLAGYESYEEACETAIKWCLEKLF